MKKALTTIAILGGIAAAVAYKLKKDEETHNENKNKIQKHDELLTDHEKRLLKHGI